MEKIIFKESQRSAYVIAIVPAILTSILLGVLCVFQIGFNKPMGNHPAPNWMLLMLFITSTTGIIVFSCQRLNFTITDDCVIISFGLFAGKRTI